METSLKSIGSQPSVLSNTSVAWAMPARGRSSLPAKIMSSVRLPRSSPNDCSPSTQRIESTIFDLPLPLGPTMAEIPFAKLEFGLGATSCSREFGCF